MLLARQIPAISSCPLSQVEQTFLLFLLCFQKSKFFMVEDLCRFWHLWTDFNYANVPSIYTFLSRNIYYYSTTACLPHFGLTYIIHTGLPVMFLAFKPEFSSEEIYIYTFFLWLLMLLWLGAICQIWRPKMHHEISFFPDVSVRPYVSKAIAAALWANLEDKKWISLLSWKILF